METEAQLCVDLLTQGGVSMCFKAFGHPHETAIFDVRAMGAGHRPVGRHLVFSHELRSFLQSPALRDRLVSHAMSAAACFGNTAASGFWKDHVSRRSVEGALALHCGSGGRGVRFAIEFRVADAVASRPDRSVQQMRRRTQRVRGDNYSYEVIDDVLVVGGGSGGCGRLKKLRFSDDGGFREKDCAICFEEYGKGGKEELGRMPCSHTFHHRCLAKWLRLKPSCPLCRQSC